MFVLIVLSNAQKPPCILIGNIDVDELTVDITDYVIDPYYLSYPKCVCIDSFGENNKWIVADFGSAENGGGVRQIDPTNNNNIISMQCVHKNNPWGVSMDIYQRLHVTFPNENGGNVVIVSNPFCISIDSNIRGRIEYEIGISEDIGPPKIDGPYEFASTLGARCITTIGASSFIMLPDRIKYGLDVSDRERGLLKWMHLLREFHEANGIVDYRMCTKFFLDLIFGNFFFFGLSLTHLSCKIDTRHHNVPLWPLLNAFCTERTRENSGKTIGINNKSSSYTI